MGIFDYGKYFGAITPLADAQRVSGTRFWEPSRAEISQPHDYVLYLGCNVLRTTHLAESIVAVLKAMGSSFVTMGGPAHCCGIVHHRNGDDAVSARLTQHSMNTFMGAKPAKAVLMYCPTCHQHFDGRLETGQFQFDAPYLHVTEYMAQRLERLPFTRPIARRIGLHVHTAFEQQRTDARHTAAILRAIPGLEVVELNAPPEWGYACSPQQMAGTGGMAARMAELAAQAKAAGCDGVATVYHSCYREAVPYEPAAGLELLNYIELVAQALGLGPFEATYKRHKLAQDPEAAWAELAPRGEVHGANMKRLRDSVHDHFAPSAPFPGASDADSG